jgi:N-acetylneuraminic acid mutarotase
MRSAVVALAALAVVLVGGARAATSQWESHAPLPLPRTEVVAATLGSEIAVLGGFTAGGGASTRADAYSPALDRWRRLPDLPLGVHHAMAAAAGGRLYVLGGYNARGEPLRTVFVLERRRWRSLPRLPFARAAAGAAVTGRRIVVAGGVTTGATRLARNALAFDVRTRRWSVVPGPTPREHLGVTSFGGTMYAVAGRTSGLDTNTLHFESWRPGQRRWQRLQPIPDARGGTAAAALNGLVVSAAGEEPGGTIAEVLAYRIAERRWVRLDDLPTPRHGVGMAALGGRVFVIGGGPEPGLTVSAANEALRVGRAARRLTSALTERAVGGLTFRRADGTRIQFSGRIRAWCGAWNDLEPTRSLHIAVMRADGRGFARPYWHVFAVPADVARRRVIRFPVGISELRVRGAAVFVYDRNTGNEASSEEEGSRGWISFAPVRCAVGLPVRFSISAVLGSELSDGKPIRVSGRFEGTIAAKPRGWPG